MTPSEGASTAQSCSNQVHAGYCTAPVATAAATTVKAGLPRLPAHSEMTPTESPCDIHQKQIFVRHLDHHVAWHGASEAADDKNIAMRLQSLHAVLQSHGPDLSAMQELARKTLLGSADMRLWVVQKDPVVVAAPGTPVSPSSPSKLLYNLSSALDEADCSATPGNHLIGVI